MLHLRKLFLILSFPGFLPELMNAQPAKPPRLGYLSISRYQYTRALFDTSIKWGSSYCFYAKGADTTGVYGMMPRRDSSTGLFTFDILWSIDTQKVVLVRAQTMLVLMVDGAEVELPYAEVYPKSGARYLLEARNDFYTIQLRPSKARSGKYAGEDEYVPDLLIVTNRRTKAVTKVKVAANCW